MNMEFNFQQLVTALHISSISNETFERIVEFLEQPNDIPFHALFNLEQWAWQILSEPIDQWNYPIEYKKLLHSLALFNKNLIFNYDYTDIDAKVKLLSCVDIDQLDRIFQQIKSLTDDNHPYILITSLWFDNHSYFIHDNPNREVLTITDHINQYLFHNYFMTEQFKFYLNQLRQSSIITMKMLFYIKTCLFSLSAYSGVRIHSYPCTPEELIQYINDDYLQIIHFHSQTIETWNKDLLACIAQLISFTTCALWWSRIIVVNTKILFPTEKVLCNYFGDLFRIIEYRPFQQQIKSVRSNDETILIDGILIMFIVLVHRQNIKWFLRSKDNMRDIFISIAEISPYDEICLCIYEILGEVLDDEQLKEIKIVDTICVFFFNALRTAWLSPLKKYKHTSIELLLGGYANLTKHDVIQQQTADSSYLSLLIEMCDNYLIVYEILWGLSFNHDIQIQLRSNTSFMSNLYHLAGRSNNKQMQKVIHGLLWNLESNHREPISSINNEIKTYDIMISYSHKDKDLCKQIYNDLLKCNYRVWIDFDQMHGNVMDAMAQAIESSSTVIICMSEEYRKSNYCRAEAHYAFQRQRKIVPVVLQKYYKPDGWLLFLVGQLLYVDFTKYEFNHAINMLLKEVRVSTIENTKDDIVLPPSIHRTSITETKSISTKLPENMIDWTTTNVQDWLINHNFLQISQLLIDCDGRDLVYIIEYMKYSKFQDILLSFREDSLRRLNQHLSMIELARFQSLIEQYQQAKKYMIE